jgi:hypothetical protein
LHRVPAGYVPLTTRSARPRSEEPHMKILLIILVVVAILAVLSMVMRRRG